MRTSAGPKLQFLCSCTVSPLETLLCKNAHSAFHSPSPRLLSPWPCTAELAVLLGSVPVGLTSLGPCRMCLFSSERHLHCYSPARVAEVLQSSLSLSSCSLPGFSTSHVRNPQTTPEGKMSFQKVGLTSVSFLSLQDLAPQILTAQQLSCYFSRCFRILSGFFNCPQQKYWSSTFYSILARSWTRSCFCCCCCCFSMDNIKHLIQSIKGMYSWFLVTVFYFSYSVSCLLKACVFFPPISLECLIFFCCLVPEKMYY